MAGDHPDPSILKDGDDYYMTFSTFDSYPGLVIWHSQDLLNWQPITAALTQNVGAVWAPDLCRHRPLFHLLPAKSSPNANYVIWADHIAGPWSAPIDLHLPDHIDPGHAVGEDGSRWLFLSGGDRVRLADDGLSTGAVQHVYDPWHYPPDWDVEGFSPEGPKIVAHGGWFYLITAVGGGWPAHRAHGHRRALPLDPRAVGKLPAQPDRAHAQPRGSLVVARARHAGPGAGGRLVVGLSRL
jgi:beta-xylosidase